jgi:saccharopine dehydrogenase-like NADP-dependent oxidoreductase
LLTWRKITASVIVVIGAGSIGQAIVRRIAPGKHVSLADLKPENAESAARVLADAGFTATISTADAPAADAGQVPLNDRSVRLESTAGI